MSTKSSFREQLDRRVDRKAAPRALSSSPIDVRIDMRGELPAPVSFALLLKDNGLGLAAAHDAVTRLTAKRSIIVTLRPRNLSDLLGAIDELGLTAHAVKDERRKKADAS